MYELSQTLQTEPTKSAADTGGFFVPKPRPPRINTYEWDSARPGVYGVYNAARLPSGHIIRLERPWTVVGPATFRCFNTHQEALTYATTKAATK
jgi:hypothetical protein